MTEKTSLEAYYTKVLPHLAWSQAQIYNMLLDATTKGFDMTNMELAKALNWSINRVTPRVLELRKKGVVTLSCKRKCGATYNNAYAWKTK